MFLEASVAHIMTGDLDALIASAERARALSAGAEPAVELLATAVIGEGQIALGELGGCGAAARLRAVPDGGRPARDRRDRRHGRARLRSGRGLGRRLARTLPRLGRGARRSAVSALIHPLAVQAHLDLRRGRWAPALAGASESAELAEDTGQLALLPQALAALTLVEARLGHETDCRRHAARGLELADDAYLHAGLGLLELGLGRIPEAIEALETGTARCSRRGLSSAVVQLRPDLIEAYVRAGRREEAEAVLVRLDATRGRAGAGLRRARDRRRARRAARAGRARPSRAAAACWRPTRTSAPSSTPRSPCTRACRCRSSARARCSRSANGCGAPSSAPRRASR